MPYTHCWLRTDVTSGLDSPTFSFSGEESMKSALVLIGCVSLLIVAALPASASSGPPALSCYPGAGPCQETDHFGQDAFLASPLPGCSILTGWALISTEGNGVQHMTVNSAQDFWFSYKMEGASTIVQGTVVLDANGNPVSFAPDASKPTFTGHFQQSFGVQSNNKNNSSSSIADFHGTSSTGASIALHFTMHGNTTGSAPTIPNPNSMHFDVSCS
jgi:hypothetical protein